MTDATIQNLMKVSLSIDAHDATSANDSPSRFEFIYGIGPAGITPFEKALFGKTVGDRVDLDIAPGGCADVMGHLGLPLYEQTGINPARRLTAAVTHVSRADDREIVKAMASGGSCSDCGCGCGGH